MLNFFHINIFCSVEREKVWEEPYVGYEPFRVDKLLKISQQFECV